jgi:hypothetical protein
MIKIQLLGDNEGYLDVLENSIIALNISVADIKDVTKRTGSFSKTIVLPGTKNNNKLLNDYFEVNVIDGTFSINKIQKCLILDDNIPLFNNTVLQLINVKKMQATNMEDDIVEYEISVKDTTADFFTIINNSYLTDIDFSDFSHTYSARNIADSFSHSWVDGYKYVIPFGDDNLYPITELKPAIYAKQYWNRIHADSGFSYDWADENATNVRFDKLLIPFSSGQIKLSEEAINSTRVISRLTTTESNSVQTRQSLDATGNYSWPINQFQPRTDADFPTEIQDPINIYNPILNRYTVPFDVTSPSTIDYFLEMDWQIEVLNFNTQPTRCVPINVANYGRFNWAFEVQNNTTNAIDAVFISSTPTPSISGVTFSARISAGVPSRTIVASGRARVPLSTSDHQRNQILQTFFRLSHAANRQLLYFTRTAEVNMVWNNAEVRIQTGTTQLFNTLLDMNQYIPQQIKQSDFVKSIMTMFNLFVEVDPIDPNKLIYTSRDDFYDSGALVDWTDKLAREDEQEIRFLPELSAKSYIFSYKEDSDPANKGYKEVTNEIYGQHQVIFSNNYVKGVERKEIIFSPTPSQESNWGSVLPLIPSGDQKYNIRILLDNGNKSCQRWFLINWVNPSVTGFPPNINLGSWVELNYYPLISHLNADFNPTFDLNFGVCDFYFYDIRNITNNNLFNNFWRRTCGQINNGRLLTAYFHLKGVDIANLRLNAKIRIDNSYWNINKIIDFDANKQELTKVELMSIDDDLNLPSFGPSSEFLEPGRQLPPTFSPVFLSPSDYLSKSVRQEYNNINHENRTLNNSNNGVMSLGNFNHIDGGVKGIIVGDFIQASQSGIYVGNNTFIGENLGNVGGLPSTLVVDNRTDGTDIIVDGGSKIISGTGSTLSLYSINEINSKVDNSIDVYEIKQTAPALILSVLNSGTSSTYSNTITMNNSSINGISLESLDNIAVDFSSVDINDSQIKLKVDNTTLSAISEIELTPSVINFSSIRYNIFALPAYADDAAATTAGLLIGDIYQTDGTGAAPLNVAGIVMIKQ